MGGRGENPTGELKPGAINGRKRKMVIRTLRDLKALLYRKDDILSKKGKI